MNTAITMEHIFQCSYATYQRHGCKPESLKLRLGMELHNPITCSKSNLEIEFKYPYLNPTKEQI